MGTTLSSGSEIEKSPSYPQVQTAEMPESVDRKELLRRLKQARRLAKVSSDPLVSENLAKLVSDLEAQLR
jgi:hypothetical protein